MITTIPWNKIGFKRDPFDVVPDQNADKLIWAGFKKNKQKFETIISESLSSNDTKLVLNVSRWGGGKTHSSYYFSNNKNIPILDFEYTEPFHIIVNTPKEGKDAPTELYIKILENIKISNISQSVISLRKEERSNTKSLEILQKIANSEDLGKILWLLGEEDEEIVFKAEECLFGNITATIRSKLKIRRGITSNSDKAQIISTILQLISNYGESGKFSSKRRVFLWMDELESLIYYNSKQYRPFTQTIREIIDFTSENLTVFMNFSFAEPDDIQNIEFVIGEALLDRVTEQFIFEEASLEEGLQYVEELLGFYRNKNLENIYYPFTKDSLSLLLKKGPEKTGKPLMPRTINKWCYYAIKEANKAELFKSSNQIIDSTFIENLSFIDVTFH